MRDFLTRQIERDKDRDRLQIDRERETKIEIDYTRQIEREREVNRSIDRYVYKKRVYIYINKYVTMSGERFTQKVAQPLKSLGSANSKYVNILFVRCLVPKLAYFVCYRAMLC